ncbi:hypothetical protein C7293_26215 [filamentous cyanobacterium CCT1]|nr:hypothetical protein C7293_26215 [filamentous cyanobacterium CCT1]PSN77562.1 hypothetical protein C8B47_21420 [filamentous cyanobacterium CCP4]
MATPIIFTTLSGPGVRTTVEFSFQLVATGVEITAEILSGGGQIRGIFGEVADNDITGLGASGSNVQRSAFSPDEVDRVGQANIRGTGTFDFGVEFRTFSNRVSFVLTGATLADLSRQNFGVTLQGNQGTSRLLAKAPEIGNVDLGIATTFSGSFVDLFTLDIDGGAPFLFEEKFVAEPVVGSTVTQTIVVTNNGALAATNVLVTANFIHPFLTLNGVTGAGFTNLDTDGNPATGDGNSLTGEFLIANLAAGASTTITVELEVNNNYNIFALNESVTTEPGSTDYNGVTFVGKVYTDAVLFNKAASSTEITFDPFPQLLNTPTATGSGDTATTDGQLVFLRAVLEGQLQNGATALLKSADTQLFDLDPLRRTTYSVLNNSDLIGPGQAGIAEVTSAFNLDNVDPAKLAAFETVGESNPTATNGAISLFREIVEEGAYDPDAFVSEFKETESTFVVNVFNQATGAPVGSTTTLDLDNAQIENVDNPDPTPALVPFRFELKPTTLTMRASKDGNVIGTAHASQNGPAPNVDPFRIFALNSADAHPFTDRTFVDRGEAIGIADGDDRNSSKRKRIDGDEILGLTFDSLGAARAFIDVEKISSLDGATIEVKVLNNGSLVTSELFNLGTRNSTATLSLFPTSSLFDEVRISAADSDTQFTFRGITVEAMPT